MASLAEEILKLTNPAPILRDPEEADDVTDAKIPRRPEASDFFDDEFMVESTRIRRNAAPLLDAEDKRYSGKKTSRKKLNQLPSDTLPNEEEGSFDEGSDDEDTKEASSEASVEEDSDDEESEENETVEDKNDEDDLESFKKKLTPKERSRTGEQEFSFQDDGDYGQYADSLEGEEGSEENIAESQSESEDEEDTDDEEDSMEDEDQGGIHQFSKSKVDEEIKKGEATKMQLRLWEQLLKTRIEVQKVLLLVNQLPQPQNWRKFAVMGEEPYLSALQEGQKAVKSVLDKVFFLQSKMLLQHPDTKHLVVKGKERTAKKTEQPKPKETESDEEITSESDMDAEEEEDRETGSRSLKRRHELLEYPEQLTKRHKAFTQYRDETIQKWFDKTRVATGKLSKGFGAFEESALKQIRQILADHDRLVKRTQLKRSTYRVLGTPEGATDTASLDEDAATASTQPRSSLKDRLKEYDEEIFDDDDFYHQLLRELIERKTLNTSDPIALSRQWLELQKLRSKVKKKVDTRASKGRKIRYDILPKLVNFMAPIETSSWTDEARDELYTSLFGQQMQGDTRKSEL